MLKTTPSIEQAFHDSVERLAQGQSLEDCLRLYPQYAVELRPLLLMALSLRQLDFQDAARDLAYQRIRGQVLEAAHAQKRKHWRPLQSGLLIAALLLLIFGAFLIFRPDEQPTPATTPTYTPTTITITPTFTSTASPEATATPSQTVTATTTATASSSHTATATVTATATRNAALPQLSFITPSPVFIPTAPSNTVVPPPNNPPPVPSPDETDEPN